MSDRTEPFVHLRVHSAYSLLEGALTIQKLATLARADETPALALTDSNKLFGALEFSEAMAEVGVREADLDPGHAGDLEAALDA